jgi:hypothetical protein
MDLLGLKAIETAPHKIRHKAGIWTFATGRKNRQTARSKRSAYRHVLAL